MSVSHLLEEVSKAGLTLKLTDQGKINAKPADRLTPALRELIQAHKAELGIVMRQKAPTVMSYDELYAQLIEAAMRCCDYWGDGELSRIRMQEDIQRTPKHHWPDLLTYFIAAYGKCK